jgi:hypothetical protein
MSRAFRDPTMSVFDEALGATPQIVLETQSTAAGVTGQGGVMGLNPNTVLNINGVNGIIGELGTTGNSILNAAHKVIQNAGTRSAAQHIRDVAKWLIK